ncbi:MAG: hypothetical protein AAFV33_23900, partial [Chloroflexota bacterium]
MTNFTISKRQRRVLWLLNVLTTLAVMAFAAALVFAQDDGGETIDVSGAPIDVLPLSLVTDSAPVVLDIT